MKILMVLTSHDELGDTGDKTGVWLEEFAAPYYVLKDAGHDITLASPAGGKPPLDPKSDEPDAQTAATERYKKDSGRRRSWPRPRNSRMSMSHRSTASSTRAVTGRSGTLPRARFRKP